MKKLFFLFFLAAGGIFVFPSIAKGDYVQTDGYQTKNCGVFSQGVETVSEDRSFYITNPWIGGGGAWDDQIGYAGSFNGTTFGYNEVGVTWCGDVASGSGALPISTFFTGGVTDSDSVNFSIVATQRRTTEPNYFWGRVQYDYTRNNCLYGQMTLNNTCQWLAGTIDVNGSSRLICDAPCSPNINWSLTLGMDAEVRRNGALWNSANSGSSADANLPAGIYSYEFYYQDANSNWIPCCAATVTVNPPPPPPPLGPKCKASSPTISAGSVAPFDWNYDGSAPFTWSGGETPPTGSGNSFLTTFSTTGTKTVTITDSLGRSGSCSVEIVPASALQDPLIDFKVNGQNAVSINYGETVNLTWNISGSVYWPCSKSSAPVGWGGTINGSSGSETAAPSTSTTYEIACQKKLSDDTPSAGVWKSTVYVAVNAALPPPGPPPPAPGWTALATDGKADLSGFWTPTLTGDIPFNGVDVITRSEVAKAYIAYYKIDCDGDGTIEANVPATPTVLGGDAIGVGIDICNYTSPPHLPTTYAVVVTARGQRVGAWPCQSGFEPECFGPGSCRDGNESQCMDYAVDNTARVTLRWPPNRPPQAAVTISKDNITYGSSITVTQGDTVPIFLSAAGSTDPDSWTHTINGVNGAPGKCEWNRDLNQGAPSYEQPAIDGPANPSVCNVSLGSFTFNDTPDTYTYQVLRITDMQGEVSNIATVQVVVNEPAPTMPTGFLASNATCTRIILTWNDNSNETGYRLYRSPNPPAVFPAGYGQIGGNLPAGSTSYTDNPPVADAFYNYALVAYNGTGDSPPALAGPVQNRPCVPVVGELPLTIIAVNGAAYNNQVIRSGNTLTIRATISNTGDPAVNTYLEFTDVQNMNIQGGTAVAGSAATPNPRPETRVSGNPETYRWNSTRNLGTKNNDGTNWLIDFDVVVSSTSLQPVDFFQGRAVVYYQGGSVVLKGGPWLMRTGVANVPQFEEVSP